MQAGIRQPALKLTALRRRRDPAKLQALPEQRSRGTPALTRVAAHAALHSRLDEAGIQQAPRCLVPLPICLQGGERGVGRGGVSVNVCVWGVGWWWCGGGGGGGAGGGTAHIGAQRTGSRQHAQAQGAHGGPGCGSRRAGRTVRPGAVCMAMHRGAPCLDPPASDNMHTDTLSMNRGCACLDNQRKHDLAHALPVLAQQLVCAPHNLHQGRIRACELAVARQERPRQARPWPSLARGLSCATAWTADSTEPCIPISRSDT